MGSSPRIKQRREMQSADEGLYGSIGLTNFGYLDKEKIGIIRKLDRSKQDTVNTFIDDIVAAIAVAAASRIAHYVPDEPERDLEK